MCTMLLVVNGIDFSIPAVKKAIWLAKKEGARVDILYVSPSCNRMYPEIPGLCFWMPESEYKVRARELMERIMNEQITPLVREADLESQLFTTDHDQDREIKRMSEKNKYEKIFITGHSKYCCNENSGWFRFWGKPQQIPSGTVCLI